MINKTSPDYYLLMRSLFNEDHLLVSNASGRRALIRSSYFLTGGFHFGTEYGNDHTCPLCLRFYKEVILDIDLNQTVLEAMTKIQIATRLSLKPGGYNAEIVEHIKGKHKKAKQ